MPEYDREKVVDCMFDPVTSAIIAQLEDGEKECSFLAKEVSVYESDVQQRLDYLVKTGFVTQRTDDQGMYFSANTEKLTSLIEQGDNFDSAIAGLEKMDSYLN